MLGIALVIGIITGAVAKKWGWLKTILISVILLSILFIGNSKSGGYIANVLGGAVGNSLIGGTIGWAIGSIFKKKRKSEG